MTNQLNYQEFYNLVSDLVAEHETNTLFGTIDGNRSLIISIQDGKIVSLACGAKRGAAAIPMVRQMISGRFRIENDIASLQSVLQTGDLPATTDIMASLSPSATQDESNAHPSPGRSGITADSKARKNLLCELLNDYLGPAASIVCEDEVKAAGGLNNETQIMQVIKNLAKEIEDPTEAHTFTTNALEKLGLVS